MTPRFPRTEPLIPDDFWPSLVENGRTSEERDGFDPFPVVKLFTPDAGATWLMTEAYPEGSDIRLFGLCDLGMGCPELGYADAVRDRGRARQARPAGRTRPLFQGRASAQHLRRKIARHAGMIVT
jgi:hypothetical protein